MRPTNRFVTLAATVTLFVAAFAVPAIAAADSQFVSRINASRAAAGKTPLEVYWDLSDDARSQSAAMAAAGKIFHNPNLAGVTSGWQVLAENVGVGIDVGALHQGFMASPGHRANILGDYNYIGVGVTIDAEGQIWVTTIFMKADPGLNGGGTTTTTTQPPATTTTTIAPPSSNPSQEPDSTPTLPKPIPAKKAESPATSPVTPVGVPSSDELIVFGRPFGPYAL